MLEGGDPVALRLAAMSFLKAFLRDERGATAIEYGLLAGLLALVIIVALTPSFNNVGAKFNRIGSALNSAG